MLPLQDIKTWPTLNLSQIPSLAAKLGLSDLSDLSLFDPQNTIWIPMMDHALLVGTNDKIYMRRKELVSCGPASCTLLEYLSPTHFELPRSSQKRRVKGSLDNGLSPVHSTVSACRDYSHNYAGLSSPPSSPSRSSSPPLPPTNCAVNDNSGTPHNPDLEWEFGTVPTPKGAAVVWPQGMSFLEWFGRSRHTTRIENSGSASRRALDNRHGSYRVQRKGYGLSGVRHSQCGVDPLLLSSI
ncbi:uncharacterized protein LACBIDRAFT_324440 [Laccaria bicolor S238N-H82]|uniref:Predicted protein n=1 Tax=Laccaria bicolor (strain S238N-H82 / ATCC MYA-4686) TaxID=486041 RepID=B0D1U0_LACBS|nr:uncharacterized protein LACBIDRAFT_324440 [Laccaria bicolor S238N-H82]EDR12048.1 predicted protein [Laccaria bicolor S238N-H82]|eukprot:XP_001877945.1 predicted protein [Laccaria bicolor S238N-H82]